MSARRPTCPTPWSTTTGRPTAAGSPCACSSATSTGTASSSPWGAEDLRGDERFNTPEALGAHIREAVKEIERTLASLTLDEARAALATQPGQFDLMKNVLELPADPQAVANGYVQQVEYDGDVVLPLVAAPAQFDRTPPALAHAPDFGADTDEFLAELGMDEEEILQAKIAGAVV